MALFPSIYAVIVLLVLLAIQPLLFKLSCTLTGRRSPGFFASVLTTYGALLAASVVGGLYAITLGVALSAVSVGVSAFLGALIAFGVTAVVYSAALRIALSKALWVTAVHHGLAYLLAAGVACGAGTLW